MAQNKDFVTDVFIKEDSVDRVNHYVEHVQKLFNVELRFTSSAGKQFMPVAGQWLDVEGQRENVIKAREYVKGLSTPEEVVRLRFPPPVYELICGKDGEKYYELEHETAANIVFYSIKEVEISGSISGVTKASTVIEEIIRNFIQENSAPLTYDEEVDCSASIEGDSGIYVKCNHGSDCFDSHSCSENRNSTLTVDEDIDEISITLSSDSINDSNSRCNNCSNRNSQADILECELMEYAKKLGYSEGQVKSAMKKLGPDIVEKNDLLHELIKASNSIKDDKLTTVDDGKSDINNIYESISQPQTNAENSFLRHIVVDGSNVAISHGKNQVFSCRGIAIVVNWFQKRGHAVTVFVPNWRKEASKPDTPIVDQEILTKLNDDGVVSFTPSRRIGGKLIQSYDDRYIVRLAVETDGIIVSNDHFRDIQKDIPEWKDFINKRLLMYTFAGDIFMPPDDPLGRQGPSLKDFLCKNFEKRGMQYCPYGRKCTFGPKCKFYHPERRRSGSFLKKPLPPLPHQHSSAGGSPGGGSRPRSDPGQNLTTNSDNKQRPISLPNLEQLYISPPQSLHRYIYIQNPNQPYQRPVSGPPFPENYQLFQTNNDLSRTTLDVPSQTQPQPQQQSKPQSQTSQAQQQQQQMQTRKFSGDFSHYGPNAMQGQFVVINTPPQRPPSGEFICHPPPNVDGVGRPLSAEYICHPSMDNVGRPLSSDFGSRPSSGEFGYNSGSRPCSGDFGNSSRPSSGEYGSVQWGLPSYQRPFNTHGNFYPMKSYYKTCAASSIPETKEEPRQNQGSLKIELVEKLRELYPDQYDKILYVLRTYPEISCIEDATPFMNEVIIPT